MVNRRVNFDSVARPYRWMEYASFGPALARCRSSRLDALRTARRALVYGDGDGRFLARLVRANPALEADVVDSSAAMLGRLRVRVQRAGAEVRIRCHNADALAFVPPRTDYDLVVTHFFLDCFDDAQLARLLPRIAATLAPGGRWLISEFAIPNRGPMRMPARAVVGGLYRAFGVLAGLRVRQLPDYATGLRACGLVPQSQRSTLGGLLRSELWAKT